MANGLDQDVAAAGGDEILPAAAQDTPQPVGKAVEEAGAATEPVTAETLPPEEVVTQTVPDPHSEPVAAEVEASAEATVAEATEQVTVVTSPVSNDVIGNNNDNDYANLRVEAQKIVDRIVYLAEKIVTGKIELFQWQITFFSRKFILFYGFIYTKKETIFRKKKQ